jgi:hypothetical protein
MVNDMGKFFNFVFYFGLAMFFLLAGLGEKNELMCCAAGLIAIAAEIAAKD